MDSIAKSDGTGKIIWFTEMNRIAKPTNTSIAKTSKVGKIGGFWENGYCESQMICEKFGVTKIDRNARSVAYKVSIKTLTKSKGHLKISEIPETPNRPRITSSVSSDRTL